jgi:WD40 repeat protein
MRLAETPVVVPLTNRRLVRRVSINPSGTEVVIGQLAHGQHRALSRWHLPDLTPLPGPDLCPLTPDRDFCNVLIHGGDNIVAVAGLRVKRLSLMDLAAGTSDNPVNGEVFSAAMTDRFLAVSGTSTQILDRETNEIVWQADLPTRGTGDDNDDIDSDTPVPIIAFHPTTNSFAVGGWGKQVVEQRSLNTREIVAILPGAPAALQWLGFSPDGGYLLAIADAGAVTVWRAGETEPCLSDVFGIMDYGVAAFHPDGEHCAMGMWSGYLGLHRLSDGALVEGKTAHNSGLNALAFTPDGKLLLTGGDDGKLLAWHVDLNS